MEIITFVLNNIPDTGNYLVTRMEGGRIIKIEVLGVEHMIDNWLVNYKDKTMMETLKEGLRSGAEILLYDEN